MIVSLESKTVTLCCLLWLRETVVAPSEAAGRKHGRNIPPRCFHKEGRPPVATAQISRWKAESRPRGGGAEETNARQPAGKNVHTAPKAHGENHVSRKGPYVGAAATNRRIPLGRVVRYECPEARLFHDPQVASARYRLRSAVNPDHHHRPRNHACLPASNHSPRSINKLRHLALCHARDMFSSTAII